MIQCLKSFWQRGVYHVVYWLELLGLHVWRSEFCTERGMMVWRVVLYSSMAARCHRRHAGFPLGTLMSSPPWCTVSPRRGSCHSKAAAQRRKFPTAPRHGSKRPAPWWNDCTGLTRSASSLSGWHPDPCRNNNPWKNRCFGLNQSQKFWRWVFCRRDSF